MSEMELDSVCFTVKVRPQHMEFKLYVLDFNMVRLFRLLYNGSVRATLEGAWISLNTFA